MKYILFVFVLISLASCNNIKQNDEPSLKIAASVLRAYDTTRQFQDTRLFCKAFDIKFSIENESKKAIAFWMMSCSWEDNFIINNDYVDFASHGCDNNTPLTIQLKPNESKVLKTTIFKFLSTRYQEVNETKFGFIYIDSLNCSSPSNFDVIIGDKSKHDKIIWSNPLYLNDKK